MVLFSQEARGSIGVAHHRAVASKLPLLREPIRQLPANVHLGEVDFGRQSSAEALQEKRSDRAQPTVFLWEGVRNYLSAEAVDAVVRFVAGCEAGPISCSRTWIAPPWMGPACSRMRLRLSKTLPPWASPGPSGSFPKHCHPISAERGRQLDREEDARRYRFAYFGKAAEAMSGYDLYHVAVDNVPDKIDEGSSVNISDSPTKLSSLSKKGRCNSEMNPSRASVGENWMRYRDAGRTYLKQTRFSFPRSRAR